ncbi:P-loop containing nucleoside triphosphate hydrolase protein [Echria macrotheca]|uniref:ATP-dependent RNA helicase n=1 Tax=Echria macrotheca TaxID=438768 RepID=A0AAJ0F3A9_9PEZI|nr:P-loop containing nucleoside triphosphate hydrolase protein [Echria macrotheca]
MKDSTVNPAAPPAPPLAPVAYSTMNGKLRPELLRAVAQMGFTNMTPVQEKTLNLPSFTDDCLVKSRTGTGKTLAFLLPVLHTILTMRDEQSGQALRGVKALVLAPTRELAKQISDECEKLTAFCVPPIGCHMAVGGTGRPAMLKDFLKRDCDILVATPGRLIDILEMDEVRAKFARLRCVILDEADRMLDHGFGPDLKKILAAIPSKTEAKWQGMCFSATIPPQIETLLPSILGPKHHRISCINEGESQTIDSVPQSVITVRSHEEVLPTLHKIFSREKKDNPSFKAVIFSSTARQAALMYNLFGHTGGAAPGKIAVHQMHSRMSQPARNRTVAEFKEAKSGLLFASDVVGRGLDFPDITLVIQVGFPMDQDQYVHRVGRTGRAGKSGRATMIMVPEEMGFVEKLKRDRKFPIEKAEVPEPAETKTSSEDIVHEALGKIPDQTLYGAYTAYLGFLTSTTQIHRLSKPEIVRFAGFYARSLGFIEPPAIPRRMAKMTGLWGTPGIRIEDEPPRKGSAPAAVSPPKRNRPEDSPASVSTRARSAAVAAPVKSEDASSSAAPAGQESNGSRPGKRRRGQGGRGRGGARQSTGPSEGPGLGQGGSSGGRGGGRGRGRGRGGNSRGGSSMAN